jgi:hypothetical protein
MASLARSAADVSREFQNLAPFARAARPALIELGKTSQQSQPALLSTIPLAQQLDRLGTQAQPTGALLDRLTSSLDQTGAIQYLMSLLYYGVSATNMYDSIGHLPRTEPMVGACASYVKTPTPGCEAKFTISSLASDVAGMARSRPSQITPDVAKVASKATTSKWKKAREASDMQGLLNYLIGSRQ